MDRPLTTSTPTEPTEPTEAVPSESGKVCILPKPGGMFCVYRDGEEEGEPLPNLEAALKAVMMLLPKGEADQSDQSSFQQGYQETHQKARY